MLMVCNSAMNKKFTRYSAVHPQQVKQKLLLMHDVTYVETNSRRLTVVVVFVVVAILCAQSFVRNPSRSFLKIYRKALKVCINNGAVHQFSLLAHTVPVSVELDQDEMVMTVRHRK